MISCGGPRRTRAGAATAEQWAAYRALWDGSLSDDASFRRAFDTIRPLYFFDPARAVEQNAVRADIRYRLAVRKFIIEHEYARLRLPGRARAHRVLRPWSRSGATTGSARWIRARRSHRLVPDATLAIFEHSGHSPQVEEREAFARRLADVPPCRGAVALIVTSPSSAPP